jgi:hypothetical protein
MDRIARLSTIDGTTRVILVTGVTSLGGAVTFETDVTDYAPALFGQRMWEVYLSTGADPTGAASGSKAGYNNEISVTLTPGRPPRDVLAVVPLWNHPRYGQIRNDAGVISQPEPFIARVNAPAGATGARVDVYTTGHGIVPDSAGRICDEACPKRNFVGVDNTTLYNEAPWVSCAANCTKVPQDPPVTCLGVTYDYMCKEHPRGCPGAVVMDRSGWCPGRPIGPFKLDAPAMKTGGHQLMHRIDNIADFWQVGAVAVFFGTATGTSAPPTTDAGTAPRDAGTDAGVRPDAGTKDGG